MEPENHQLAIVMMPDLAGQVHSNETGHGIQGWYGYVTDGIPRAVRCENCPWAAAMNKADWNKAHEEPSHDNY